MNHISFTPIKLADYLDRYNDPKAGAVVSFCGNVRNHNKGEGVDGLFYEAQEEMAETMIAEIVKKAVSKWALHDAFCMHRVGQVNVGEAAVIVITCASHRKEAYEANEWILNEVKFNAPIWKKEFFSSGEVKWGHNSEDTPIQE